MTRDEQARAIWQSLDSIDLINDQFRHALVDVLALAALAFDDDAGLGPAQTEAVEQLSPFLWSHAKGQLEHAVRDSGIGSRAASEWTAALEAVYRIGGSEGIAPAYGGGF